MDILDWQCSQLIKLTTDNIKIELFNRIQDLVKIIFLRYSNIHYVQVPNSLTSKKVYSSDILEKIAICHSPSGKDSEAFFFSEKAESESIVVELLSCYLADEYDDYAISIKDGQRLYKAFCELFVWFDAFEFSTEHSLLPDPNDKIIIFNRAGHFLADKGWSEDLDQ